MDTLAQEFQAISDHYREAQPHKPGQRAAYHEVFERYTAFKECKDNQDNLLTKSETLLNLRRMEAESAFRAYQAFM